ncbi:MAG: hypothetical protein ACOYM8_04005 [Caulobacterales bacterium]
MANDSWFSRSNIISIVGIAIGVLVGLFGAAFSLPGGQRMLCSFNPMFCRSVPLSNAVLSVAAFERTPYCAARLRSFDPTDLPPGMGYTPLDGSGGCGPIDLSTSPAYDALQRFGSGPAGRDAILALQLSFDHAPVRAPTPFSVRVACSFQTEVGTSWVEKPCQLGDPVLDHELFGQTSAPSALGHGQLIPDTQLYGQVFVLSMNGDSNFASLAPGAYRIILNVGDAGELIEEERLEAGFEVVRP